MREKLKSSKGITLVALIITIIVLLILAVVAIRAVQGDGIINHAKNASASYKEATVNEQDTLDEMLNEIREYDSWWTLTGKEATELEDLGEGSFLVASNGIQGSLDGGRDVILLGNKAILIEIGSADEFYIFFISEEAAGDLFESPTKDNLYKWYKKNADDTLTEYTGESPIQKNEFTTINSETYLQKVIDSFGK